MHGLKVLQPLLDIDIYNDISAEDGSGLADTGGGIQNAAAQVNVNDQGQTQGAEQASEGGSLEREEISGPLGKKREKLAEHASSPFTYHQSLATPAVRHLLKSHNITITDITGTGKDGRVLKDDVHDHISKTASMQPQAPKTTTFTTSTPTPLTPIQAAMFKTMTASLSIPHFLYTTPVHLTPLNHLRARTNPLRPPDQKLSTLPFILKAVSQAFSTHPLLNASLSTTDAHKPTLSYNSSHDFGIAVDTPFGLLVPVVRGVQSLSVAEISAAIKHLSAKAREGKLAKGEMSGATFTVSNIGAVGGGVVAPVIVGPQVAILGVGRARVVPAWDEEQGTWVKRDEAVLSWSADHRVVDGAECARAAEKVCALVENVEAWGVDLR